ncbi:MAG: hypothetical protein ABR567_05920 [Myxococcales bacterium]
MQRIASLLALALLAGGVRAEEVKAEVKQDPNHVKIEKKHKRGRHTEKTKVESSARHRAGGGTVAKTETTQEHDRPGIGNDTKTKTTETVERDANGKVIRQEKKVQH